MNIIEVMQLPVGSKLKNSKGESFFVCINYQGDRFLIGNNLYGETFTFSLTSANVFENYSFFEEEEEKKVDFMKAIKAYREGKEIYCKFSNKEHIHTYKLMEKYTENYFYYPIKDEKGIGLSIGEILEGQWYIKNN